jgi:hypothetical protein
VLKDLPKEWNEVVVMDWSDGFWDKMEIKHNNLVEKLMKSMEPDSKSLKLTHFCGAAIDSLVFCWALK